MAANCGNNHGAMIRCTPAGVKCSPSLRICRLPIFQVNLPFGQTFLLRSMIETCLGFFCCSMASSLFQASTRAGWSSP